MPRLSVIVPTNNSAEHLRDALECLVTQSVEDFEVIIVDCKSEDGTAEITAEYCREYVDFYSLENETKNISDAMNKGFEHAKGTYVWFYAPDSRVNEDVVEYFLETAEKTEADCVVGRLWHYGDFDPYYDMYTDATVVLPKFDKYERSVLWDDEICNKIYRRGALISKKLSFTNRFKFAAGIFNLKACLSGMKITGCATACYQRREGRGLEGFSSEREPTLENAKEFVAKMTEIYAITENEIRQDTGSFDGDEAFIQEVIYVTAAKLMDNFYRYFWHLDAETLTFVHEKFNEYIAMLNPDKLKKLQEANNDIVHYAMLDSHEKAAEVPYFSFMLDLNPDEELTKLIDSLYIQSFFYFEIFARESQYESEFFPVKWKKMPNLHVIPEKNFHNIARGKARSKVLINLRESSPIDYRVLAKVYITTAPAFTKALLFQQTRNGYKVKRTLKEKGVNLT